MTNDTFLGEMQQLEDRLLHSDFRQELAALEQLLDDDFVEVSPIGTHTARAEVLQWLLQKDPSQRWQLSEWQVHEPASGVRVVRYHAMRQVPASTSKGACHLSLWRWNENLHCWRLWFHQSTKVQ